MKTRDERERPYGVAWDGHFVRFTTQENAEMFAACLREQGQPGVIVAYVPKGREGEAYLLPEAPL